jgi:hypothetical protein
LISSPKVWIPAIMPEITSPRLTINLDGSLPSGTGQFAQQVAVLAREYAQTFGNREDELLVGS